MQISRASQHTLHSQTPRFSFQDTFGFGAPKSYARRALKYCFSLPKSKLELFVRIARGITLAAATLYSTPLYVGINKALVSDFAKAAPHQAISDEGLTSYFSPSLFSQPLYAATKDSTPAETTEQIFFKTHKIDNFVKNYSGFNKVIQAILQANIDPKLIDLNKNGVILDNSKEIDELINKLSTNQERNALFSEAINTLNEIKQLSTILWGESGPSSDLIQQNDGECQLTADLIGICLKPVNVQNLLKSNLKVTDFNLSKDKNDFFINMEINISGKAIKVTYSDLKTWEKYDHSNTPLAPYAFIYALEKELAENYMPCPSPLLSASSTLITGKQHYTMPVAVLSDKALEKMIQEAPDAIIKLGTYPEYLNTTLESLGIKPNIIIDEMLPGHAYAVKGSKTENGRFKVVIKDTSIEREISMEELRNKMLSISIPSNMTDADQVKNLSVWLIALIASYALTLIGRYTESKSKQVPGSALPDKTLPC